MLVFKFGSKKKDKYFYNGYIEIDTFDITR